MTHIVLQERLLSPRILHFTRNQLFWECSECTLLSETFPHGDSWSNPEKRSDISKVSRKGDYQFETWAKIVENYTRRNLTKPSDKLPAIAAVAQRVQGAIKHHYIAGHFRSTLPESLLWSTSHPSDVPSGQVQKAHQQEGTHEDYRGPTWSWASCQGEISYQMWIDTLYIDLNNNSKTIATVLHTQTELVDPQNAFGPIKFASITIRGPVQLIQGY